MSTSVAVRRMEEVDLGAADRLLQAAFERPTSFLAHARLTRQLQPDGVLVAVEHGQVVGTVGAVDYGRLAYIGLMAVEPSRQGRGIGRLLMDQLLRWLDDRGCPSALLDATDKGARLYETLEFVDDATAIVFERAGTSQPTSSHVSAATSENCDVSIATPVDMPEMVAFDTPIFGADRSKLFAALWPEHRARCLIARDRANRPLGYLFARETVLGPWAAADARIAEQLLRAASRFTFEQPLQVLVPRSSAASAELLKRHGFIAGRRLRHMRRGGAPPGTPERLFGQSSFAHG